MGNKWVSLTDVERAWILARTAGDYSVPAEGLRKKIRVAGMRITHGSAKGKGRALQQWVCQRIAELVGVPYNQQDDECLIHSREMGQSGTDVVLRGIAAVRFPYSVECKSSEGMSVQGFVIQASKNVRPGTDWLVVYKCKALDAPVVIMSWATFASLERIRQGGRYGSCV